MSSNLPKDPLKLRPPSEADLPRRHLMNIAPPYFMELVNDAAAQYLSGHVDTARAAATESVDIEQKANHAMFRVYVVARFDSCTERWYFALPFQYCDEPLGRATRKGDVQMSVQMEAGGPWKEVLMYEPPENKLAHEAEEARVSTMRPSRDPLD